MSRALFVLVLVLVLDPTAGAAIPDIVAASPGPDLLARRLEDGITCFAVTLDADAPSLESACSLAARDPRVRLLVSCDGIAPADARASLEAAHLLERALVVDGEALVEADAATVTASDVARVHERGGRVVARVSAPPGAEEIAAVERALDVAADLIVAEEPEVALARALRRAAATSGVRVVAHRCGGRYAPENTLPALDFAARLGVDAVECDVRRARDGERFLLHDRTLDRTTSGRGPLADALARDVAALDAGAWLAPRFAGVRVPTFEAFLAAAAAEPGRLELYVDAKEIEPDACAAALARHGLSERAIVYQRSRAWLARLRGADARLRTLAAVDGAADVEPALAESGLFGVDVDLRILTPALVARFHARGLRVFVDALGADDRPDVRAAEVAAGVDWIETDHPLAVLDILSRVR